MVSGAREIDRRLLASFATVLDYPEAETEHAVRACEELVSASAPEAAALVAEFRAFAAERPLGQLQELYTAAFDLDTLSDLDATCYPYVGHHLFGESHKRSAFLVGLAERFRQHGFSAERELPDHLVVLLRFAAACPDDQLVRELIEEAIVPALERMTAAAGESDLPLGGRRAYLRVLEALRLALARRDRELTPLADAGGPA